MYLIDTSAWILHFSASDPFDLRSIAPADERVLCPPVYQEILQGIRDETVFRDLRSILEAALWIESPMTKQVFDEAASLYRLARRKGLTVRSSVDCLIAACAIRHDLTVLHRDRDFKALSFISGLEHREV